MNCEQIEELLVPYLDNELEPDEATELSRHLTGCGTCRERLAFLRQSAAWISSALADPVTQQTAAPSTMTPAQPATPVRTPIRKAWKPVAAALWLLLFAGGMMLLLDGRLRKVLEHSQQSVARHTPEQIDLRKTQQNPTPSGPPAPKKPEAATGERNAFSAGSEVSGPEQQAQYMRRLAAQRAANDPQSMRVREERDAAPVPSATKTVEGYSNSRGRYSNQGSGDGDWGTGAGGYKLKKTEQKNNNTPNTWKRSIKIANTSTLMIGNKEKLPLEAMQVAVRLDGFRARVLIDFYFRNTHNRQYEGTFKLRLPNGASPYFLAFGQTTWRAKGPQLVSLSQTAEMGHQPGEIMARRKGEWATPKEARMVPRAKAARAYDQTVRRRVDPALMEWAGAGVFSARIFPIAPRKVHRVVLGYDVDLIAIGGDQAFQLDLPENLPRLAVDLGVTRTPGMSIAVTPKARPVAIAGRQWYRFDDPEKRSITVRLKGQPAPLLVGSDREIGEFFAARFRPQIPQQNSGATSSRGVFILDTSLSANPERFNVWLKILLAILEQNRKQMKQFAVLCFNVETFWYKPTFIANTAPNAVALRRWCRKLALEGATNLQAALSEAVRPGWLNDKTAPKPYDLFLLSDGSITWGNAQANQLKQTLDTGFAGPLFAYRTGLSGTDLRMLTTLTRHSQGALFSIAGEDEVAKVATAHTKRPWRLVRVKLAGASDLLLAGRPRILYPGQRLLLVGRGKPQPGAAVELRIRRGAVGKTLKIKLGQAVRSELTARVYGQVAVGELESLGRATEKTATPYARHFRITGQSCSLLMLESEADYRRFNIKPEQDAALIAETKATHAINAATDRIGDQLGNAKADFIADLDKLRNQRPFVRLPAQFQTALQGLETSAFHVTSRALSCKQRTWKGIPGDLTERLASRRLDYDELNGEAQRRLDKLGPDDALKALSSLVENRPGDLVLARDVCLTAMRWGLGGQAYHTLRRVARSRPWEPLAYHAMAQCLVQKKQIALAMAYFEIGLAGRWDNRYGAFRRIVGIEYLNLLRKIQRGELETPLADYASKRLSELSRLLKLKQADLLITIAWNTDSTDIDLHVIEPNKEHCSYKNRSTKIGGRLTQDVTQGYGPEMYTLQQVVPGTYTIFAKYFSNNRNRASARTKVYATIYRNWGTPQETVQRNVVLLQGHKEMQLISVLRITK